jgi:pimeloyl-ACP methyl ester carboxylesterase
VTSLVFVHGLMGGSQQWQQQQEAFLDFNCIALDLPGFGKNAQAKALNSIADFADWALGELSTRGVQRFNLVGHSMGGMVAQEMIAFCPGVLRRSPHQKIVPKPKGQSPPPDGFRQLGFCTKSRPPPMKIARRSRSFAELRQFLPG